MDWQGGVVQEEVVEAARAEAEASLQSVPRRGSLTRSMLVADLKFGSGEELAMMSAVSAKRLSDYRPAEAAACGYGARRSGMREAGWWREEDRAAA